MKKTLVITALSFCSIFAFAQKKVTTSAVINFDATTSIDTLPKASNKSVVASLNTKTGEIAFEASVKNFSFSNPLMQDHFNGEYWMSSEKFPKATFKGKIMNLDRVNFSKSGKYEAQIEGELNIKGVSKAFKTTASINAQGNKIMTSTKFNITLADFGIEIPKIADGKVSQTPSLVVSAKF